MEFETLLTILKDYDLPSIIIIVGVYLHINKRLCTVDKAVNNREKGAPTLSQEVSQIHRKVDVSAIKSDYVIKELDSHRDIDEKQFSEIGRDIKGLHKRVTELTKKR